MSLIESTNCGRQLAAPTQNVERHVATNSTSGNSNRRRGGRRRSDSRNSGRFDHSRPADPPRDVGGAVRFVGCLPDNLSFAAPANSPSAFAGSFDGDAGNFSGGRGSDGLGVLIENHHTPSHVASVGQALA